jgi:hypothetical protein
MGIVPVLHGARDLAHILGEDVDEEEWASPLTYDVRRVPGSTADRAVRWNAACEVATDQTRTRSRQQASSLRRLRAGRPRLQGELRKVQAMKDELVDLRLRREINDDAFRSKQQQLVSRERKLQEALGNEAKTQTQTGEQAVRCLNSRKT